MSTRLRKNHLIPLYVLLTGLMIMGCSDESDSALSTNGPTDTDQTTATRPNILLIITDDQGIDASAQYAVSQDLPNTPNIDRLATNGVVFENMWATPSCTTTRGSLLTGSHGVNSGVDTTPSLLDTSILTLQRHLGTDTGSGRYATSVFGKWHVAGAGGTSLSHPNDAGVDYYAGNIAGVLDDYFNWPLVVNGSQQTSSQYHTSAITDMAIDWIGQQSDPWFTWIAYAAPHSPFHLPPTNLHNRALSGDANDIANNQREYFLAAIEAMDTEIGRLLNAIPEDQLDNTLVMVIGDNGSPRAVIDRTAFPVAHGKNSLYEGGIRVPFIASGGPVSKSNARQPELVNTVDLFPTLSEAAGLSVPANIDGVSFLSVLNSQSEAPREFNYSEFIGSTVNGWVVRDTEYKLIEFADGSREFYKVDTDIREENNLISQAGQYADRIAQLESFAARVRNSTDTGTPIDTDTSQDITGQALNYPSASCADLSNTYTSFSVDVNNNQNFSGKLQVQEENGKCIFTTNAIPNHNFNDGAGSFPNDVSEQNNIYTITTTPEIAANTTALSLTMDNAVMLNGVKVDLLAAACYGVGNERTGCNDPAQPWRFDPMHAENGFRVDSHHAHAQPDGTYHYHSIPSVLVDEDQRTPLAVVGFAADGFPIYGGYFDDNGTVRKAVSGYRLKSQPRPEDSDSPGGIPDGTYRDDYEFVDGLGDLDECNGMSVNGTYGYYTTDEFPYVLACFKGTPDASFFK